MPRVSLLPLSGLLVLFLVLACGGVPQVEDTPENRSKAAAALAQLEIDNGGLDEVLDDGADWGLSFSTELLEQELGRELSADDSSRVREVIRSSLAEIVTAERWLEVLTEVYSEIFTAQELEEIRTFFQTPAGEKVLETESTLSERVEVAGDAVFEAHLDEFVAQVDRRLAEEFAELAGGETP